MALNASRGVMDFAVPPDAGADWGTLLRRKPTSKGNSSLSTSKAVAWAIKSFMEPVTVRFGALAN